MNSFFYHFQILINLKQCKVFFFQKEKSLFYILILLKESDLDVHRVIYPFEALLHQNKSSDNSIRMFNTNILTLHFFLPHI